MRLLRPSRYPLACQIHAARTATSRGLGVRGVMSARRSTTRPQRPASAELPSTRYLGPTPSKPRPGAPGADGRHEVGGLGLVAAISLVAAVPVAGDLGGVASHEAKGCRGPTGCGHPICCDGHPVGREDLSTRTPDVWSYHGLPLSKGLLVPMYGRGPQLCFHPMGCDDPMGCGDPMSCRGPWGCGLPWALVVGIPRVAADPWAVLLRAATIPWPAGIPLVAADLAVRPSRHSGPPPQPMPPDRRPSEGRAALAPGLEAKAGGRRALGCRPGGMRSRRSRAVAAATAAMPVLSGPPPPGAARPLLRRTLRCSSWEPSTDVLTSRCLTHDGQIRSILDARTMCDMLCPQHGGLRAGVQASSRALGPPLSPGLRIAHSPGGEANDDRRLCARDLTSLAEPNGLLQT